MKKNTYFVLSYCWILKAVIYFRLFFSKEETTKNLVPTLKSRRFQILGSTTRLDSRNYWREIRCRTSEPFSHFQALPCEICQTRIEPLIAKRIARFDFGIAWCLDGYSRLKRYSELYPRHSVFQSWNLFTFDWLGVKCRDHLDSRGLSSLLYSIESKGSLLANYTGPVRDLFWSASFKYEEPWNFLKKLKRHHVRSGLGGVLLWLDLSSVRSQITMEQHFHRKRLRKTQWYFSKWKPPFSGWFKTAQG